jgi:hypothetical protein
MAGRRRFMRRTTPMMQGLVFRRTTTGLLVL